MKKMLAVLALALGLLTVLVVPAQASVTTCTTCVGVIGDSLTYQYGAGQKNITNDLVADGWDPAGIKVDGLRGRPIAYDISTGPGTLTLIQEWRAAGYDPQTFYIALGSNNKNATPTQWTTQINKVLTEIGPGHNVVWMELGIRNEADSQVAKFNANLATIAAGNPEMTVAKAADGLGWNTWIHTKDQTGIWLSTDTSGYHMTAKGYVLRNQFYTEAIHPFKP